MDQSPLQLLRTGILAVVAAGFPKKCPAALKTAGLFLLWIRKRLN
jgi:hypothetical protein